jgi:hypothetical protein
MPRARAIECTWRDRSSGMVVLRVAISVLPYCWRPSVVKPAVSIQPREEFNVKVAATPAPRKVRRWPAFPLRQEVGGIDGSGLPASEKFTPAGRAQRVERITAPGGPLHLGRLQDP